MSIVGPRPLAVIYLDYYNDEEKKRHEMPVSIPFRWRMLWSCSRERLFLLWSRRIPMR